MAQQRVCLKVGAVAEYAQVVSTGALASWPPRLVFHFSLLHHSMGRLLLLANYIINMIDLIHNYRSNKYRSDSFNFQTMTSIISKDYE